MRDKENSRKSKLKSKKLAPANYLIVCEGKQTEPNYFNGLKKRLRRELLQRKKIGRNEKCPCGSGKKYKQCCLKKSNLDI